MTFPTENEIFLSIVYMGGNSKMAVEKQRCRGDDPSSSATKPFVELKSTPVLNTGRSTWALPDGWLSLVVVEALCSPAGFCLTNPTGGRFPASCACFGQFLCRCPSLPHFQQTLSRLRCGSWAAVDRRWAPDLCRHCCIHLTRSSIHWGFCSGADVCTTSPSSRP